MQSPSLISPLDPAYTAHRDAQKRQQETSAWLERRERELAVSGDVPVEDKLIRQ